MTGVRRYLEAVDQQSVIRDYPPAPEHVTLLAADPDGLRERRLRRLQQTIARAWQRPFYRDLWRGCGFEPGDLKSIEELAQLPAFTVSDLRASIAASPPFGRHQAWDRSADPRPHRVLFSGGTTGAPRPVLHSARDREIGELIQARHLWAAGITSSDTVMVSFGYGPHNAAATIHEALYRWIGCLVLPVSTGNVTSSVKQVTIAREFGATAWIGMSDYLIHLAQVAQELGLEPLSDFRIATVVAGGDARAAAQAWGAEGFGLYGTYELQTPAGECQAHAGLHYSSDAHIINIADVDTGAPATPGGDGNLVFTSLYNEAFPIVRFNTLDRSALIDGGPCACGDPTERFVEFLGRTDTMIKLRGVNVWPEEVGAIASEHAGSNGEYVVVATRESDADQLTVYLELESNDPAAAADAIELRLKQRLGVRIAARPVSRGSLAEQTGLGHRIKPVRFIDRRDAS